MRPTAVHPCLSTFPSRDRGAGVQVPRLSARDLWDQARRLGRVGEDARHVREEADPLAQRTSDRARHLVGVDVESCSSRTGALCADGTVLPRHARQDGHQAASAQGSSDYAAHWAGQGAPLARAMPAAELVRTLAQELEQAEHA